MLRELRRTSITEDDITGGKVDVDIIYIRTALLTARSTLTIAVRLSK